ncbi:UPF0721 transmembrane protein [Virgisporangium aliadipatigenens]|uniref:Probable membrane transporter protein n=1 Tax=Virgisporangium aliadipatigenens TaxID=741659 RepID=A0A8J3YW80_9ACTN|nr:sulfite exporter TauE/SafE family protein [Virgisporangium aliadipatigenens]GIJ51622.1 UPF0721 transmembrane protein [Virgisporangium aliadipatigenens]
MDDLVITLAGLAVGCVVGMTGMGGGALMTPILVLFFGIPPLAAVSSDLVVSAVMKPVGAGVHLRRGTVHRSLVGWLCLGSVPAAFGGVLIARALGDGEGVQEVIKLALGAALLLAAAGMVVKAAMSGRRPTSATPLTVRPLPTVLVGVLGGIVVGMTSVGSGSLIIIALLLLYPALKANDLVGTDLVQAVPLVVSAAVAHLIFGDFQLDLTLALLLGALPGVYLGAQLSSRMPAGLVRRALVLVLLMSALKLLGAGNVLLVAAMGATIVLGTVIPALLRRRRIDEAERPEPREPAVSGV